MPMTLNKIWLKIELLPTEHMQYNNNIHIHMEMTLVERNPDETLVLPWHQVLIIRIHSHGSVLTVPKETWQTNTRTLAWLHLCWRKIKANDFNLLGRLRKLLFYVTKHIHILCWEFRETMLEFRDHIPYLLCLIKQEQKWVNER